MRAWKMLVFVGISVIIVGCVRSLHPLFTENDLVFDPMLVGTWAEEDEKNTWTFQKSGDKAYELTYTEDGVPSQLDAHLGRLGNFLFLDLYPREPDLENDFYKFHLLPAHTFWRVWIEGDVLRLAVLDNDWLKEMVDQKKVKIGHERLENSIILTASTKKLQDLVVKFAEDTSAFPRPASLDRQE